LISGLALISLGFIIFSPPSPHDQRVIEEKIMAQQIALQKKQLAEANNKVPMSLKAVAEKYKVQPVVAEKASQMNVLALGDSV
ncbi:acetyltransferase, partial [Streptococcus suis]